MEAIGPRTFLIARVLEAALRNLDVTSFDEQSRKELADAVVKIVDAVQDRMGRSA